MVSYYNLQVKKYKRHYHLIQSLTDLIIMPNAGTCPLCCSSHELSELLGYFHTRHQKKRAGKLETG